MRSLLGSELQEEEIEEEQPNKLITAEKLLDVMGLAFKKPEITDDIEE